MLKEVERFYEAQRTFVAAGERNRKEDSHEALENFFQKLVEFSNTEVEALRKRDQLQEELEKAEAETDKAAHTTDWGAWSGAAIRAKKLADEIDEINLALHEGKYAR